MKLAGELRTTANGSVITLNAPDTPLQRRALHGLCADPDKLGASFPCTDLPVRYEVRLHHSEAPI